MPIIDTEKLSPEITDKYSIVSNAFSLAKIVNPAKDVYTNEPKDEINVIVGDDKVPEFMPQIKLERWTNETNFSVRLKDTEYEKATVTTDKDKIIWDKDNIKIEFYDYTEGEGGHKMVWYLKEKPLTNKVEFTIQSKSLDFFYQPPLTEEYQNGFSEEFKKEIVVSETQVKDLEGNVLVERPIEVVNSYAVYHSTKGGMNDAYGKDYKVGKAFHIYRPRLIDAEGKETWGILHIENGIYSVEIPQDFLDKAVYPIKSNDTFGNTTAQATNFAVNMGGYFQAPANGTITTISSYIQNVSTLIDYYADNGYYIGTTSSITTHQAHGTSTLIPKNTKTWRDIAVSGSITSGTYYWLVYQLNNLTSLQGFYDSSGTGNNLVYSIIFGTYETWNNNPTGSFGNAYILSIYATYTAAGGATPSWRDVYQVISNKSQIISENRII